MPRKTTRKNTNGHLEEAMATLITNQALSIQQFARIESELMAIRSLLLDHQRTLDALPEAIRQKIGFKNR